MPRSKPTKVTEHRVTLGNYERDLIHETLDDLTTASYINSITPMITPIGQLLGYSALGVGVYYGLSNFQAGFDKTIGEVISAPFQYDPADNYENSQSINVETKGYIYGTFTTITESIRKAMRLEFLPTSPTNEN